MHTGKFIWKICLNISFQTALSWISRHCSDFICIDFGRFQLAILQIKAMVFVSFSFHQLLLIMFAVTKFSFTKIVNSLFG